MPTLPVGFMLKEVTGCKLVVDCHEWWYKQTALWENQDNEKIEMVPNPAYRVRQTIIAECIIFTENGYTILLLLNSDFDLILIM